MFKQFKQTALSAIVVATTVAILNTASIGNAAELRSAGRQWPASRQIAIDRVDHKALDALLRRYVDKNGLVDYRTWKKTKEDVKLLDRYLQSLSQANPSIKARHDARLAYWINAYNALTLRGILAVYPTSSIRKHTSRFGGYNIWKDLKLTVGKAKYSLDDIEHKILRKMNEPRIHFAIVCAAIGCPRLRNEAFTAKRVQRQLADNSRHFFAQSKHLKVDVSRRTLHLSAILKWFGNDFGKTESERLKNVLPYLPAKAAALARTRGVRVNYLKYDWRLNERANTGK